MQINNTIISFPREGEFKILYDFIRKLTSTFYSCPITCFWWYSPIRESPSSKFLPPPIKHLQMFEACSPRQEPEHTLGLLSICCWCQRNKTPQKRGRKHQGCPPTGQPGGEHILTRSANSSEQELLFHDLQ